VLNQTSGGASIAVSSVNYKKCSKCGKVYESSFSGEFCEECGTRLSSNRSDNKALGELSQDPAALMAKYGITFTNKKYVFRTYSYDSLKDAVNYAKKCEKNK
jgi:hypothetical protein